LFDTLQRGLIFSCRTVPDITRNKSRKVWDQSFVGGDKGNRVRESEMGNFMTKI
jgi:hypothetical protein